MFIGIEPYWKRAIFGYPVELKVCKWASGTDYLTVVFQTNFGEYPKKLSDLNPEQQMLIRKALMEMEE